MLSAQFGVSIFGVAATVTAFMLGLGAGSLLAVGYKATADTARALKTFSLLELSVALYALALPALSEVGGPALESLAAQTAWWQWYAMQAAVAIFLLALPAAAMGASFPIVLRAYDWSPQLLGRLYGLNSLGAAGGALISLALLAALGWSAALRAIAWITISFTVLCGIRA